MEQVQLLTLTVTEYTGERIVSNQHVVSVAPHKTVHCYGSVKICRVLHTLHGLNVTSVYFTQLSVMRTVAMCF